MDFVPSEKGVPIRQPSTANLMIDSTDRNTEAFPLANNFQIQRSNSILNGFFTRIGTTELVLDWFSPNISPGFTVDSLTTSVVVGAVTTTTVFNAPIGFYTQAQLIQWMLIKLNSLAVPGGVTWTVNATVGSGVAVQPSGAIEIGFSGSIADKLGITSPPIAYAPGGITGFQIYAQDLRPYTYLDFVSTQLTYNQNVKDASTAPIVRDVLARWYFAYDQPPTFDIYGFPILMGYTPFCLRRTFSPPKQIKWEANMPIGNLTFQVYSNTGDFAVMNYQTQFQMTLQISEV